MNKIINSLIILLLFTFYCQAQNPCEDLIENGDLVEGNLTTYFLCPGEEVALSDDNLNDFMSDQFSTWLDNCNLCEQYIYTDKNSIIDYINDNTNNQNSNSEIINAATEIYVTQLKNFAMGQFCELYTITFEVKDIETQISETDVCLNESINLSVNTTGFSESTDFNWTFNGNTVGENEDQIFQIVNEAGNYSVTVTDNDDACSITSNDITFNLLSQPTFSFQSNNETVQVLSLCTGDDIQVDLVFNDGSNCGDCTIIWTLDETELSGITTTNVINQAGEYIVVITNSDGCKETNALNVTENGAPNVNIQLNNQTVSEADFCSGSAITVSAAVDINDNCEFQWFLNEIELDNETNAQITISQPGEYSVIVTNTSTNCFNSGAITVTENQIPEVTINLAAAGYCESMAGTIDITSSSNDVSFNWEVLNSSQIQMLSGTNDQTVQVETLVAGNYSVSVENIVDGNGCEIEPISESFIVNALPEVVIATNNSDADDSTPNIYDMCSGNEVVLTVPDFNVVFWSDGSSNDSFIVGESDNYTVIAIDDNGCTNTAEINVNVLPIPDLSISIPTDQDFILCTNEALEITADLEGNNANPQFIWLDGIPASGTNVSIVNSSSEQSINGMLLAINDFGCQASINIPSIEIYDLPVINEVVVSNPSTCNQNGSIQIDATDNSEGDLELIYILDGIEYTDPNIPDVPVGQGYSIELVYANQNCSVTSDVFNVTAPGAVLADVAEIDLGYCVNDTLFLAIQNTSEIDQSSIVWSFSEPTIDDVINEYSANIVIADTFESTISISVDYIDNSNCANSFNQSIDIFQLPQPVVTSDVEGICIGETANLSVTDNFATYLWNTNETSQSIEVMPTTTSVFSVTVTDENGCINESSASVEITPLPIPVEIEQVFPSETNFCGSSKVIYKFEPLVGVDYSWSITGDANELYFHDFNAEQNFVIVEWNSSGTLNLFQEIEGMCSVESEIETTINTSGINGSVQRFGNSSTLVYSHPSESQDISSWTYQWYYVESDGEMNILNNANERIIDCETNTSTFGFDCNAAFSASEQSKVYCVSISNGSCSNLVFYDPNDLFNGLRNNIIPIEVSPTQYLIYPSITNSNLILDVNSDFENLSFKLFDLTGRLVWSEKINSTEKNVLDVKSLMAGTYIGSISNGNATLSQQKLIIY